MFGLLVVRTKVNHDVPAPLVGRGVGGWGRVDTYQHAPSCSAVYVLDHLACTWASQDRLSVPNR